MFRLNLEHNFHWFLPDKPKMYLIGRRYTGCILVILLTWCVSSWEGIDFIMMVFFSFFFYVCERDSDKLPCSNFFISIDQKSDSRSQNVGLWLFSLEKTERNAREKIETRINWYWITTIGIKNWIPNKNAS